ncbi:MAG: hypothetical protein AAFN77_10535 [Planctomycetota bacterium]
MLVGQLNFSCLTITLVTVSLLASVAGCRNADHAAPVKEVRDQQTKPNDNELTDSDSKSTTPSQTQAKAVVDQTKAELQTGTSLVDPPSKTKKQVEPKVSKKNGLLQRQGTTYSPGQLHKNNTTLMLVYEGDIRADILVKKYQRFIDETQIKQAKTLVRSYHDRFVELRQERAAILEHATDDQDVAAMLLDNKLDIVDLMSEIRIKVMNDIMTKEQSRVARETFRRESLR